MTLPIVLTSGGSRKDANGEHVRKDILAFLAREDLRLAPQGPSRPWGVEVRIAESDAARFVKLFFADTDKASKAAAAPSGPRILAIRHQGRLSWPIDGRKTSFVRLVSGAIESRVQPVVPGERVRPHAFPAGACVFIPARALHRLVSIDTWSILAIVASGTDFSRN